MTDTFQVILLAILQGITEFLPISSSAHLILPSKILGWPDQGLTFDVAVHFGTLLAVVIYFRKQLLAMVSGLCRQLQDRQRNPDADLAWKLIIATLPAVIAGFLVDRYFAESIRQLWIIGVATIVFGIVLWLADKRHGELADITFKMALIIGLWQCLALIPGTSRSGITMTAALFLGITRVKAAEFSFLLSIPLIVAASVLKSIDIVSLSSIDWHALGLGVVVSFVSAFLCIHFFLRFIGKLGFSVFVIYRLLLGSLIIYLVMV